MKKLSVFEKFSNVDADEFGLPKGGMSRGHDIGEYSLDDNPIEGVGDEVEVEAETVTEKKKSKSGRRRAKKKKERKALPKNESRGGDLRESLSTLQSEDARSAHEVADMLPPPLDVKSDPGQGVYASPFQDVEKPGFGELMGFAGDLSDNRGGMFTPPGYKPSPRELRGLNVSNAGALAGAMSPVAGGAIGGALGGLGSGIFEGQSDDELAYSAGTGAVGGAVLGKAAQVLGPRVGALASRFRGNPSLPTATPELPSLPARPSSAMNVTDDMVIGEEALSPTQILPGDRTALTPRTQELLANQPVVGAPFPPERPPPVQLPQPPMARGSTVLRPDVPPIGEYMPEPMPAYTGQMDVFPPGGLAPQELQKMSPDEVFAAIAGPSGQSRFSPSMQTQSLPSVPQSQPAQALGQQSFGFPQPQPLPPPMPGQNVFKDPGYSGALRGGVGGPGYQSPQMSLDDVVQPPGGVGVEFPPLEPPPPQVPPTQAPSQMPTSGAFNSLPPEQQLLQLLGQPSPAPMASNPPILGPIEKLTRFKGPFRYFNAREAIQQGIVTMEEIQQLLNEGTIKLDPKTFNARIL